MSLTTNPSYPATPFVSGGGTSWANIANILSSGAGATNVSYTENYNHYSQTLMGLGIKWKDSYGNPFVFPNEANIKGIQMTVSCKQTAGSSAVYGTYGLVGVPTSIRQDSYPSGAWSLGATNSFVFGGATDLWGATVITPLQLNSTGFGWSFKSTNTQAPGSGADVVVFYTTLKVWFTLNAGLDQASVFNVWGSFGPSTWSGGTAPTLVQPIAVVFNGTTATLADAPTPGNTLVGMIIVQSDGVVTITNPAGTTPIGQGVTGDGYGGTFYTYSIWSRIVEAGDSKAWTNLKSAGVNTMYVAELTGNVGNFKYKFNSQTYPNGSNVDIVSQEFSLLGQAYIFDAILYIKSGDVSYIVDITPSWIGYAGGGGGVSATTQIAFGVNPTSYAGSVDFLIHNAFSDVLCGGILLACWS